MADSDERALQLSPEKFLTFTWDKPNDAPLAYLTAKNSSSAAYVAYKVKTTAPKRYVVRPPQGCIAPGQQAAIKLTMVQKDAEGLWRERAEDEARGVPELKSDDKFLVQTAAVSQQFYTDEIQGKDDKTISATLQKLWKTLGEEDKKEKSSEKKAIKSSKLTTHFSFPDDMASAESSAQSAPVSPSRSAPPTAAEASVGGDPDAVSLSFGELSALRKKYDDLVQYTVVLTGERDYLQQDCEAKKAALEKAEAEASRAVAAAKASGGDAGAAGTVQAAGKSAGFAFVHVLAVALVAFVVGRLIS